MNITKEQLIAIINEEMENASAEEASPESKEKLRQRMLALSKEITSLRLDNKEIVLINEIFTTILKFANDKSSSALLARLKEIILKRLGLES